MASFEQAQTNAAFRWRKRKDAYRVRRDHVLTEVDDGKVVCLELDTHDVIITLPNAVSAVGCTLRLCVTRSTDARSLTIVCPRPEQLVPQVAPFAPALVGTTLRAFSCGLKWHLLVRTPAPIATPGLRTDFGGARIRDLPNSVQGENDVVSRRFVTEGLANFFSEAGCTMESDLAANGVVTVRTEPYLADDVVNADYVDAQFAATSVAFTRVALEGELVAASIVGVEAPDAATDMANKAFVDAAVSSPDRTLGDVRVTQTISAGRVVLRTTPTDPGHAASRGYVDQGLTLGFPPTFMHRTKAVPQTVATGQAALRWPTQASASGGLAYVENTTLSTIDAFVTVATGGVYAVAWSAHRSLDDQYLELWVSVDAPVGATGLPRHGAFSLTYQLATAGTGLAIVAVGAGSQLRTMCLNAMLAPDILPPSTAPQDQMSLSIVRIA